MERDYEVLSTLGEGSFGKVYKARHRVTGEEVAAKEIKLGSNSFDEALNSMELKALKALRHPCIVRLRELLRSQKDGSLFFIFEFISSDFGRLIKGNPRGVPETQTIELVRQMFVGIAHMHQHGFFHRDIKPENILYDPARQTIRIADFGEARSLRARPPFTDYVGTRWYRAPECLLRDCNYASQVDMWAAGLVFAELLSGSPIFAGSSSIDQLNRMFLVFGVPSLSDWPDFKRLCGAIRFTDQSPCGLQRVLPNASLRVQAAISQILILNPQKRPSAKKCLEYMEIFTQLPSLDLQRLDSNNNLSSLDSSRLDTDRDREVVPSLGLTPPPSGRRPLGIFGAAGAAVAAAALELHNDLDLDAELDDILGESPKKAPSRIIGMPAKSMNEQSITSLLNGFSFDQSHHQSSSEGRSHAAVASSAQNAGYSSVSPGFSLSPPPAYSCASPSGGVDAILASLEADF